MKLRTRRRLNQQGFLHHVIPILAFVALFCIMGGIIILRARAAAPGFYIQPTAESGDCLSNLSGDALIEPCKASDSVATTSTNKSGTIIEINGACLEMAGTVAVFQSTACQGKSTVDYWHISDPLIRNASSGTSCLNGTAGKPIGLVSGCSTIILGTQHYYWQVNPAPSSNPAPNPSTQPTSGGRVTPTPVKSATVPIAQFYNTAPQACTNNVYSTKNVASAYYCVAALQTMLNAMKGYDGYGQTLTIDGQFGNNTANSLTDYQKYENVSLGSKPITALAQTSKRTWQFLCWSMVNRKLTSTTNPPISQAYKYVECTQDGISPATKKPS